MWNLIQDLPNNPAFVLILVAVAGYVWFNARRWSGIDGNNLNGWWTKHICAEFPSCYNPKCFECNLSGKECRGCPFVDPDYRE